MNVKEAVRNSVTEPGYLLPHEVQLDDYLTDDFVSKHTDVKSVEELLQDVHFNSPEEFLNLDITFLDAAVKKHSRYQTFVELLQEAVYFRLK